MFFNKLFNHFKSKSYPSKVNHTVRLGTSFGKKAIFAGSVPQSGGEFIYEWDSVIKRVKENGYILKKCLMLGVAGGDGINSLQKYYPGIQITGIEIDPVILKVALENKLFTPDTTTTLKIADAITWIEKGSQKYDLIIVDLYLGDQNVTKARREPFLEIVRSHLSAKGIILYSCHYNPEKQAEYDKFNARIKKLYAKVEVVFEFPKNKILLIEK